MNSFLPVFTVGWFSLLAPNCVCIGMDKLNVCSARIVNLPDDCSEEDRWKKIRNICKEVFTTMICGIISYMKKVKMRRDQCG